MENHDSEQGHIEARGESPVEGRVTLAEDLTNTPAEFSFGMTPPLDRSSACLPPLVAPARTRDRKRSCPARERRPSGGRSRTR